MQLKYKDFEEYKADVPILRIILAVDPLPEYVAVTPEKIVPCEVLVPTVETNAQESKLHGPGKLKYSERATVAKVY